MMSIYNNLAALQAKNLTHKSEKALTKASGRLSSGMKLNGAKDDASGYVISERMRVMIRGLKRCNENLRQGASLTATASGGLDRICDILTTVKELAINSANETNTENDRKAMQNELDQLLDEVDNIAVSTEIFGIRPLMKPQNSSAPREGYTTELGDILLSEKDSKYYPTSNKTGTGGGFIIYSKGHTYPDNYLLSTDFLGIDIRVRDENGNTVLDMNLKNSTDPHLTKTKNGDQYLYQYANGDTKFSIIQSYELIKDESAAEGGEYYSLKYDIANEGTKELGFDFSIMTDPVLGVITGTPTFNGSDVTTAKREDLTANDGKIIFNSPESNGDICQVTGQLTGKYIENQPDAVVMNYMSTDPVTGNPTKISWGALGGSSPVESYRNSFEHYTVGWLGKTLPPGGSFMANTLVGLSYPLDRTGSAESKDCWIQSGMRSNQGFYVPLCDATTKNLGLQGMNISTADQAGALLGTKERTGVIDKALDQVLQFNTVFGACQMRMEYCIANNTTQDENTQNAESVIRDADMAREMTQFMKQKVLQQASQAMMTQANHATESVLSLLE